MKAAPLLRSIQSHLSYSLVPLLLITGLSFCDRIAFAEPKIQATEFQKFKVEQYTLAGPYTHSNLSIYLVHGTDQSTDENVLTLQEALGKKIVTVHETGEVNELRVENTSAKYTVFLHSGDIVKGGKQDRALSNDFLLPPKSGKVPVASFCVEQGRWQQREGEQLSHFESSDKMLSTKDLKVAARAKKDQTAVWNSVAEAQAKLSENIGSNVRSGKSESSLQLALENEDLKAATEKYLKKLQGIPGNKPDALGYAFYINGELNSVEIYSSNRLFNKLWPRLIEASATEAVTSLKKKNEDENKIYAVDPNEIKTVLLGSRTGKPDETELSRRVRLKSYENDKNYLFETVDKESGGGDYKHRSYILK